MAGDRSSAPVSYPPARGSARPPKPGRHGLASVKPPPPAPAQSELTPAPGVVIGGKYRLTHPIGAGGMGEVWAAEHRELGLLVAVKLLRPRSASDALVGARFAAEARIAAAIKHRFVVDIFDYGTALGVPFMVLELLQGEELGARIQSGPAFAVKNAVQLVCECLSGLEAVHRAGIIHRDLKPENIFLVRDHERQYPKLLDFGIAQINEAAHAARADRSGLQRRRRLTKAGITVGTPSYMAPEQLRAQRDLDGRADVYSMGVILFELLTGAVPFAEANVADLLVRIMTGEAPQLSTLRPELGRELSDVLQRAMAKEREQRFASAAELRDALLRVLPKLPHDAQTLVQDGSCTAGRSAQTSLLLRAAKNPFAAPASKGHGARAWQVLQRTPRRALTWVCACALAAATAFALSRPALPTTPALEPTGKLAPASMIGTAPALRGGAAIVPNAMPSSQSGGAPKPLAATATATKASAATKPDPRAARTSSSRKMHAQRSQPGKKRIGTRSHTQRQTAEAPKKLLRHLDF